MITILFGIAEVLLIIGSAGMLLSGNPNAGKTIFYLYFCTMIFIVTLNLGKLFKWLHDAETPFTVESAKNMKKVGQTLMAGGFIGMILFPLMEMFTGLDIYEMPYTFGITIIVVGMIFTAFALIFEYGCKLQQESDETL